MLSAFLLTVITGALLALFSFEIHRYSFGNSENRFVFNFENHYRLYLNPQL